MRKERGNGGEEIVRYDDYENESLENEANEEKARNGTVGF